VRVVGNFGASGPVGHGGDPVTGAQFGALSRVGEQAVQIGAVQRVRGNAETRRQLVECGPQQPPAVGGADAGGPAGGATLA
jgi:hypothetical protein